MGYNYCRGCGHTYSKPGIGRLKDPSAPWWAFWRTIVCPECGGDGLAKPPGWPDKAEMARLRPTPPQGSGLIIPVPHDASYNT
jgi:hypothetical protein